MKSRNFIFGLALGFLTSLAGLTMALVIAGGTVWPLTPQPGARLIPPPPAAPGHGHRTLGSFTTLVSDPQKYEVACPPQTDQTGVLLVAGQSNASNTAQGMFTTKYPLNVVNYFEGKCYPAASPLLGAENEHGEFLTPLGDGLVSAGTFTDVVIVTTAIGGSRVAHWAEGGDLNSFLITRLADVRARYRVTDVIWHQGEADFAADTSRDDYRSGFLSVAQTLTSSGVDAPIFMSIASRCSGTSNAGTNWIPDNPIALAQKALIDGRTIRLGVDSDALLTELDRRDGCHLSESGQLKIAAALANAIGESRK
ncbi:MAG: sialate O-acetylesterase [Devosia sp.]